MSAFFYLMLLNLQKKNLESVIKQIESPNSNVALYVKREDLIHPFVSGNKYRKLKYNLIQAKLENESSLLTFGGAFSNHIAAVAFAGKENGLKTIGVIRGDELFSSIKKNPTLQFAKQCGMEFVFVSREQYQNKDDSVFFERLKQRYGNFYLLPEGGTNDLAVKGCQEIITNQDAQFDYICAPVGTGGTLSGMINASFSHQKILGFPALKGTFLTKDICKFATKTNWELIQEYHFGGYAKVTNELIHFLNSFYRKNKVPLDPIYTGKMVFGVMDLIQKDYFPKNSKILLIHTGGLQGIKGMNELLKSKNKTLIEYHD